MYEKEKISERELEQNIRTAMEHAAPDKIEQILASCRQTGTNTVNMEERKRKRGYRKIWGAAGAAAAAVLLFSLVLSGMYLRGRNTELPSGMGESIILLDVNPSLSITVDAKEVVTKVNPLNEDGKIVLGEMKLEGANLDVALNALIGSMLQNGYLNELQNSILVSVENADAKQAAALQDKVRTSINTVMESGSVDGAVISQTVTADEDLQQLASQYGISLGKAAVIKEAVAQDERLAFEDLVSMSITEIALLMDSKNITPDSMVQTGTASDKAYIGKEKAVSIAYEAAGADAASIVKSKVEFDSDHGVFVYEVEFNDGKMKYDYDIDARTGEIRKQEKETMSQKGQETGQTQTPPTETQPKPQETYTVSLEAAKEAALNAAGVSAADAVFTKEKKDRENGVYGYELEFRTGETHYEYFVDGSNGQILKAEKETVSNMQAPNGRDDDHDWDDDDRYDDDRDDDDWDDDHDDDDWDDDHDDDDRDDDRDDD